MKRPAHRWIRWGELDRKQPGTPTVARRMARPDLLMYNDVELDRVKHVATRRGQRLDLTAKEFQLLEFFPVNAERVVRRTELPEKVWHRVER